MKKAYYHYHYYHYFQSISYAIQGSASDGLIYTGFFEMHLI